MRVAAKLVFGYSLWAIMVSGAYAADGPFSAVIPYQYDLPVNFSHEVNIYSTYGEFYQENGEYIRGNIEKVPTADQFVNVQRLIQAFKIPGLPNMGFATQEIFSFVSVQRSGLSKSGMGDPYFEPLMFWLKPNKNLTVGLSDYIEMPLGGTNFTNHDWQNLFVPFYDYNLFFGKKQSINIDGQFGLVTPTEQNFTGAPSINPGSTVFTTLELAYKGRGVFKHLHPYFALDYQNVGPSRYVNGQQAGQEVAGLLKGNDLAIGGGLQYRIGRYELAVSYRRTVGGGTFVPAGNQIYYHFTYLW